MSRTTRNAVKPEDSVKGTNEGSENDLTIGTYDDSDMVT